MNDTCTCSSHNFVQIDFKTMSGTLNMAVTPCMWWLDVACSNHLMRAVELYQNLPSAGQKVRATHSSTNPWPAHVRALYTQTLAHTHTVTHTSFYTQTLLHTNTLTHRRFYTQTLLHTDAFTHRRFYTQTLLQSGCQFIM